MLGFELVSTWEQKNNKMKYKDKKKNKDILVGSAKRPT